MAAAGDRISSTDRENIAPDHLRRAQSKNYSEVMVIDAKVKATDSQLTQSINEAFSEKLKITPFMPADKNRALIDSIQVAPQRKTIKSAEKSKNGGGERQGLIGRSDNLLSVKSKRSTVSPLRSVGSTCATKISSGFLTQRLRKPAMQKSDPVALYEYYQNQWKIFRQQIPGDNSHAGLRWQIRHKMLDSES